MISEKLLSVVLAKVATEPTLEKRNIIEYLDWSNNGCGDGINIYELAHKCKEFAWRKGYDLSSSKCNYKEKDRYRITIYPIGWEYQEAEEKIIELFDAKSPPEAIFKACEWILKQY